jgi:hypothetical protein
MCCTPKCLLRSLALLLLPAAALAQQVPSGFSFRREIIVTTASLQTAWPVRVQLDTAELIAAGKLQPGCADLRFTNADESQRLEYWLESGCNTPQTIVRVQVPALSPPQTLVVLYYGNAQAADESNPRAVHIFYDDFSTDPLAGRWTNLFRANDNLADELVWNGSTLTLTGLGGGLGGGATFVNADPSWEDGWALSFRFRVGGGMPLKGDGMAFGFFHRGNRGVGDTLALSNPGYAVEIDALESNGDPSPQHIAIIRTLSGGTHDHLAYFNTPAVSDDAWHLLEVRFFEGEIGVDLDGVNILNHTTTFDHTNRKMLFAASTGGAEDRHQIDDVAFRRYAKSEPIAAVGREESAAEPAMMMMSMPSPMPRSTTAFRLGCGCQSAAGVTSLSLLGAALLLKRRRPRSGEMAG